MNIFVTGGNGFLGKNLQEAFSKTNHQCFYPTSQECNVLDLDDILSFCEYRCPKIDVILHTAAKCGGIKANINSPADFMRDNLQMGINVFEAARILRINKVYTLGSVCGYACYCPIPFKEDDLWLGFPEFSNSGYGISKKTIMLMGQMYRKQYGMGGAHLIPVNMFGFHDHFDLENSHVVPALINKFISAVETNKPTVECWGSGLATRELLFSVDCAGAIVRAIDIGLDTDLPINIGTGKDISIKDLAYKIADLTGFTGEIVFTGEVSDGQPKRRLDVSRAKDILGWTASTSLEDGLKKTIDWYKNNRDI